jgi:hypothetical protein
MWISRRDLVAYGELCKTLGRNEVRLEMTRLKMAKQRERTAEVIAKSDATIARAKKRLASR